MGSSESVILEPKTDFCTATFKPLNSGEWIIYGNKRFRRSVYLQSIPSYLTNSTLDTAPVFQELSFQCRSCKRSCFDAGLNKAVKCKCGTFAMRGLEKSPQISIGFERVFEEHCNFPSMNFVPELVSVTLAVFRNSIPENYIVSSRTNFSMVFDDFLSPFFKEKLRCVGIGDFFKQEAKFKVIGAFPSYGIVTENTVISCSEVLSEATVQRIHILPITPHVFTEEIFASSIQPYFKSSPRHVMSGDFLYIDSQAYLITTCQPNDGLISAETSFYFNGEPLEPLHSITIVPFLEDLSYHYHALTREALIEEIANVYIMSHFQGFKRIISLNQLITIDGVGFKVVSCWPGKGVTVDSTNIIYDGSMCRRDANEYYNPNTMLIRRGNLMEDPLFILAQQMAQMQQMMMEVGVYNMQGCNEEQILALPTRKIQDLPEDPEAGKCMVCLCSYEIGEEAKTLICCNIYLVHMFHSTCIDEWLRRSTYCPLCKSSVV